MAFSRAILAAAAVAIASSVSFGQTSVPVQLAVRVRVADTAHAPVAGADVSIVRGLQDVLARGTTDDAGRLTLSIPHEQGELQVTVRKLGYSLQSKFFAVPSGSTTSVELVVYRAPQTLAPVTVTATADLKAKSYHIGADEIMNSPRPLFDAMDIVTKLRPDMIEGRSGPGFDCGAKYIWVNGQRIIFPPPNAMVDARIPHAPPKPTPKLAMQDPTSGRRGPVAPIANMEKDVLLVLASIKPEHIDEMTYEDCHSTKVEDKTHANQAIFVVLKPGVAFDPGVGSFVISNEDSLMRARYPRSAARADAARAAAAPPAYRTRILGVYDVLSGDPVVGATVADSASGTYTQTTVTGTVSLVFLPEGAATLFVTKPGFVALRVPVVISPRDTTPLTLVLTKLP